MASDQGKLSSMKVEIQSKKWIKPSTPTPSLLQRHQLSSFDQLQPPIFTKLIFHFYIGNETTPADQRLLVCLEESLSEVLTLYYPFAGRFDEDEPAVSCQDQGVEFVVATVDRKLDELVDREYHNLVSSVQRLSTSDFASTPLLSVQVNVFKCGGLAIGVGLCHKVGDMFSFSMFMDAWATACRLGTLEQVVRPNFNLSSFLPPKPSTSSPPSLAKSNTQQGQLPPKFVMNRYIFTGEAIAKLKSTISTSESELNASTTNYTRVELVTAIITRSLINIERSKHAQLIRPNFLISHAMDLRSRTPLPVEENSCGNFHTRVVAARKVVEINEESSWELRELVEFIRNSIRNVSSEIGKVGDWSELRQMVEKSFLEFQQGWSMGEKVNPVIFGSWCRFGLNEVDFGWGRPSLVSTLPAPLVIITLMDHYNSDDGGIEAWVCLKEEDMARFRHVSDIVEYASS